ncbi:restriction endonuclease subunit S [Enterobacter cancerogenus]|uniref:Restriction endonuclease subunit S n=1 Tax=Enterobacter cancerogenus TaxID=69218 RepID=A0AB38P3S4_9ENTR|nr:restriction endonuclease subunit S [Enterobacter cancerogenus]TKK17694.1 restriction endonuclease subunit S [Enterobacter cancerogenus]
MAKYKAYPEYKVSGVEWLGAIPKDWSVIKLKYIADLLTAKSNNTDDLFVGLENISSGDGKYISKQENIADGTSVSFEKNDVLFGKLRPYLAKSWLATFSGVCSSEFLVLRTAKLHPKYLNYYSLTNEFIEQVNSSTYGSKMPRASWEFIGLLPVPTCSYSLSEKVAWFLDHETAKIDELIEKQQQLIELLKEKRQAVISHAVTKGLNPDIPMKDSGVEWLGEIPTHWEMKRLAYLGSARNGLTYSPENITDQESGVLVLRSSNIQNSSLCFDDNVYVDSIIPEQFLVKENDLLICSRNGSRNLIGKNALISKDAEGMAFGAFMAIFRSPLNTYIFWVLNSPLFDYQSGSFLTSTINQLTIGNLNSMEIPVPTLKEQKEIAQYLSRKNDDFIALINKVKDSITLLQERRTALISAAVTGKIDVRDWVAPDTQDVEEPQEANA